MRKVRYVRGSLLINGRPMKCDCNSLSFKREKAKKHPNIVNCKKCNVVYYLE